jgi:hypothetical protein
MYPSRNGLFDSGMHSKEEQRGEVFLGVLTGIRSTLEFIGIAGQTGRQRLRRYQASASRMA